MAKSGTSCVLILISIVLTSISPSLAGDVVTDSELKQLCSKTNNVAACFLLLKSDNRTANVDAEGLAEISVDMASKKVQMLRSQLSSFANKTLDTHLRHICNLCSKNYEDVFYDLEVALANLKSGSLSNAIIQVKDAFQEVKSCENELYRALPSNDASTLKKTNDDFKFLIVVVQVLTNNLKK